MELIIGTLLSIIFIFLLFLSFRPIDDSDLEELACKLRKRRIKRHFPRTYQTSSKNSRFKKFMDPKGGFFQTDIDRNSIAIEATKMLKYKKHEWIILAFEKNKRIELIWTNKGDKYSVSPLIRTNQQINLAKKQEFETIYIFHNHPPYKLFKNDKFRLVPSKQDLKSANYTSNLYNKLNISIAEYICANKGYRPYHIRPSDNLFPFEEIYEELESRANSNIQRIGIWFKIWFTNDIEYISLD